MKKAILLTTTILSTASISHAQTDTEKIASGLTIWPQALHFGNIKTVRSVDVSGDGKGDYRSMKDAVDEGYAATAEYVDGGCGACQGPAGRISKYGAVGRRSTGFLNGVFDVVNAFFDNLFGGGNDGGGNSGGGKCFLTTAVVELRGEADDGPTLTVLRAFRDGYMAKTKPGEIDVAQYYIVAAIPKDHKDWAYIGDQVDHAVEKINAGDNAAAYSIYSAMVHRLSHIWLGKSVADYAHNTR